MRRGGEWALTVDSQIEGTHFVAGLDPAVVARRLLAVNVSDLAAVGGGLTIEAGGSLLGGIGVSGAPGGSEDALCAAAGIEAIREDIEL